MPVTLFRLFRHRGGNFGLFAALLLPVLLLAIGIAIDYAMSLSASQRLKAAADAAVLAAINEAEEAYVAQETVDLKALITASGNGFFKAGASRVTEAELSGFSVTPKIDKNALLASLSYKARYKTFLLGMFGHDYIDIANTSRAIVNVRSFITINFLIDVSASMGIGATDADQKKVADATGCSFACHLGAARGSSSYDAARAAGAEMRIDVARNGTLKAIDAIEATSVFPGQVTVGLYTFSNSLTEISPPTDPRAANFAYLRGKIRDSILLDIENGGTNIESALREIESKLPRSGGGLSASDRIQYVVVLSDGVESGQSWTPSTGWVKHPSTRENVPYRGYEPHEVNYALNATSCDSLKAAGAGVHFIYTEYLEPIYGAFHDHDKARFAFVTDTLFPLIPTRFQTCAGSSANVLKTSTPSEITTSFVQLVKQLSAPLRLY
jgi:uncharacterized protein (UPF0333 family)